MVRNLAAVALLAATAGTGTPARAACLFEEGCVCAGGDLVTFGSIRPGTGTTENFTVEWVMGDDRVVLHEGDRFDISFHATQQKALVYFSLPAADEVPDPSPADLRVANVVPVDEEGDVVCELNDRFHEPAELVAPAGLQDLFTCAAELRELGFEPRCGSRGCTTTRGKDGLFALVLVFAALWISRPTRR